MTGHKTMLKQPLASSLQEDADLRSEAARLANAGVVFAEKGDDYEFAEGAADRIAALPSGVRFVIFRITRGAVAHRDGTLDPSFEGWQVWRASCGATMDSSDGWRPVSHETVSLGAACRWWLSAIADALDENDPT